VAQKLLAWFHMGYPLRWFVPRVVYEVTTRTIQERFLLRPSAEARDLILGVLGRGLALYPAVALYAFAFLSNHGHLMISSTDGEQLAQFIGYVNGNIAREMGRLHGWRGPFWGRRCRPIPILDDDALVGRLKYILAQGVKEGLVVRPEAWPGATSTAGLLGERLVGRWVHRDLETRALRRGQPVDPHEFTVYHDVPLTPLPCWQHLERSKQLEHVQSLIEDVVAGARSVHGETVRGCEAVLRDDPHHRPASAARGPAPACHAVSRSLRLAFRAMYRNFVDAFRRAAATAAAYIDPSTTALFPPGSYPRLGRCVPVLPSGTPVPSEPPWVDLKPPRGRPRA